MHSSTPISRRLLAFLSIASSLALATPALADSAPLDRSGVQGRLAAMAVPFVANDGQVDSRVAFYAPTFAGTVFVTRDGRIVYALPQGPKSPDGSVSSWSLTESFVAGSPQPRGADRGVTRVSSFVGDDRRAWRSDLPTYEVVRLGEVWDGVAVSLRAYGDNVEKLFTLAPGVSESRIRMRLAGALRLRTASDGSLVAGTGLGDVAFRAPIAYQVRDGRRLSVPVSYAVAGKEYGFRLGAHDPSLPVVIDPVLQSSYIGGSGGEGTTLNIALATLAIHPTTGDVYVAGQTESLNFPGVAGGAQTTLNPNTTGGQDGFIVRFNSALTTRFQSTYIGGSSIDFVIEVIVHPSGEVYVGGFTNSTDFPQTTGGAYPTNAGFTLGFISRLNAGLTAIQQSTYSGSGSQSHVGALAVRANGEIYAAGETMGVVSGTAGGAQATAQGNVDVWIARFNQNLTTPLQATYLGGSNADGIGESANSAQIPDHGGIFVHPTSAELYVTGSTASFNFPNTAGGAQPANAVADAFIARLNGDLTAINQATYLGGTSGENGRDIALHPTTGDVYATGETFSLDFPNTTGGAQPTASTQPNVYISRLNAALTSHIQSTYFGGAGTDRGAGILVHPTSGEIYVGGQTGSFSLLGTSGGAVPSLGGGFDGFITRLNSALTSVLQTTYFGGSSNDRGIGDIEIPTGSGEIYASGDVSSSNMPATAGSPQPSIGGGGEDAFITRITDNLAGAGGITPTITQTPTQTPTITQTPPLTPGGPTNTPTPTLPPTSTPTLSPTIIGGGPGGPTAPIPTLAPWTMAILALALAGIGYLVLRSRG